MRNRSAYPQVRLHIVKANLVSTILVAGLTAATARVAHAEDPLGLYVGASAGEAHARSENSSLLGGVDTFHFDHAVTGWKLFVGARPLSFLGAELAYADLGIAHTAQPSDVAVADISASSRQSTVMASAVGYLPLPVPLLDVYGKLGFAGLSTKNEYVFLPSSCPSGASCNPTSYRYDNWAGHLVYGAGAQVHLGDFALRAEYERIDTSDGNPDLLSVGLVYLF